MTDKTEKAPETFVKFTGMKAAGEFKNVPQLGERQTFTVVAECNREPHHELMADGHRRPVIGMKVLEVEPGEITPAPDRDPELPFEPSADED